MKNWTVRYLDWLSKVELSTCIREILDEYLFTFRYLTERIERFDKRIEDFSQKEQYRDNVKKLCCFPGIKTITAMALLCEIGDFQRFAKAEYFMSYLGLTPGENSSGEKQQRLNITKAGNSHIRRLLTESAHSYNRVSKTPKSKELKRRQEGAPSEVIEYADKARERLRRRYFHLVINNKKAANTANIAVARELAGFIWGMMVGKIK